MKLSVNSPKGHKAGAIVRTTILEGVDIEEKVTDERRHSIKTNIFGGSTYSKALLRGGEASNQGSFSSESESLLVRIETLKFLEGTKQLFFRKCKTFPPELSEFNPKRKRGIWNSSGRVVYYTGEKQKGICRLGFRSSFTQEVVDYCGRPVLAATGYQFILGLKSHVEIYLEGGRLLGSMNQSCMSSTYNIHDCTGRLIYKIQAPCYAPCAPFVFWGCNEHFEICMDDGVSEIGTIKKYWDSNLIIPEFKSCVGIEMDRADDVRVKALLLGCFFLIEFQYYKGMGNGPFFLLLMLIVFGGLAALSECVSFCPFWTDKLGQGPQLEE